MQDFQENCGEKCLNTIHISLLPIWDMGRGKGRVSTYLPLKALCDREHEVLFLTSSKGQKNGTVDRINVKKLRIIVPRSTKRFFSAITGYLNSVFSIFQALLVSLRQRPDVIYAHDVYSAPLAFAISKMVNSRYILRLYGIGKPNPIRKISLRMTLRLHADLYIVTNDGTSGNIIAEQCGISPLKVCFWTNGVDKNWSSESMDHGFRNILCAPDERMVLSVSRLSPSKQVDVLIRAIPNVVREYKKVKFVIVGDGEQRRYLEDLVRELGVSDFVRFTGAVLHTKVLQYMRACDVFASMNALSSICNPVLEAMICGRPVIVLNTGSTSDLVRHEYNGLLVGVNEIHRLSDYISLLLKDHNLRTSMGENARSFMLGIWPTWEQRVGLEADVIEALCSSDSEEFVRLKENADTVLDLRHFGKLKLIATQHD